MRKKLSPVVLAPGPIVTARLGHSSVTVKSQLSHGEVTAQSQLNHGDHSSVTARSQLSHGSITAGCDHFGHREFTVSSRWAVTVAIFFLMGNCTFILCCSSFIPVVIHATCFDVSLLHFRIRMPPLQIDWCPMPVLYVIYTTRWCFLYNS